MRGTFALVLGCGVALALGWSMLGGDETDPASPGNGADPSQGASGAPAADARIVPSEPSRKPTVLVAADPGEARPGEPGAGAPPKTTSRDVSAPAPQGSERSAQTPTARTDAGPLPAEAEALARRIADGDAAVLRDAAVRTRVLAAADELLVRAGNESATRAGVDLRILARRVYGVVYDHGSTTAAERDACLAKSKSLFEILVRGNGAPPELALRHKVEAGQNVWTLAKGPWKQAGVTVSPGFVLWTNGVSDARKLRVGQSLRVPKEPLTVVVRKSAFELTVLLGGAPVERFTVAVGADAKTPVGTFSATDCLKNPDWYMNGRRIPFGSPEHILGTRWIGLGGAPEAESIGIHGTHDESSIGRAVSLGCVRMRNADVERLFDWVSTGTRVEIRD
jgi:lipoprotein-anchoring transpeptidase ErfK/SrfK